MMNKPIPKRKSLKFRLTATLICSSLLIGIVMAFFLTNIYQSRIDSEYKSKVVSTANVVAHMIDGETVDHYLSTLEKDEEYEQTLESLRGLAREFGIEYIVVSTFTEEHEIFVFDTDEVEGSQVDLGEYLINSDSEAVMELLPLFLSGSRIEPYINHSAWGTLYKTGEPIYREDGSVAAYVFVSVSMDEVLRERNVTFALLGLVILLIVSASAAINLYVIRRYVIKPVTILTNAATAYQPGKPETQTYTEPKLRSGDEFAVLEQAIIEKDMLSVSYEETKRREEELTAQTDFYRKMSHSIRTPLTIISTNIQIANRQEATDHERLTKSQDEIMRMAQPAS